MVPDRTQPSIDSTLVTEPAIFMGGGLVTLRVFYGLRTVSLSVPLLTTLAEVSKGLYTLLTSQGN